jgi:hypothetical protein
MIPTAANPKTTPFELWHKKKPEVSNLRIWGCNAYVHVQKDKWTGIHSHSMMHLPWLFSRLCWLEIL